MGSLIALTFGALLVLLWQGHAVIQPSPLWVLGLTYWSLLFHEVGHVAASSRYGATVGDMGVGLYMFLPVFYVDLTGIWLLERKQRVGIDSAGIYFQSISLLPFAGYALTTADCLLAVIVLSVAMLSLANLIPFLRLDEYWILCDGFGYDNLGPSSATEVRRTIAGQPAHRGLGFRVATWGYLLCNAVVMLAGLLAAAMAISSMSLTVHQLGQAMDAVLSQEWGLAAERVAQPFWRMLPLLFVTLMIFSLISQLRARHRHSTTPGNAS